MKHIFADKLCANFGERILPFNYFLFKTYIIFFCFTKHNYRIYKPDLNIICQNLNDLKNTQGSPERMELIKPSATRGHEDFEEHFLNFHFSADDNETVWKTTVNGIQHRAHAAPPQVLGNRTNST